MPTHKEEILRRLEAGQALTTLDAERAFGCRRLAARIKDLRDEGYPIKTKMVEVKNRFGRPCRVAKYRLPQQKRFGQLPVGARFELEGTRFEKADAFTAAAIEAGPGGGLRTIDPHAEVQLTSDE